MPLPTSFSVSAFRRGLFWSVLFGFAVALVLVIIGDVKAVGRAAANFAWQALPVITALTLGNYALRFWRWNMYLHHLNIRLSVTDSLSIFMAGLATSVTPGKIGEVVKSFMLKTYVEQPLARTLPIVFTERLMDFLAVAILATTVAVIVGQPAAIIWVSLAFITSVVVMLLHHPTARAVAAFIGRLPGFRKFQGPLLTLQSTASGLVRPKIFTLTLGLSIVAWFFECLGAWYVLYSLHQNISISVVAFLYTSSTLIGALTLLPGGLGVTEGSLTGLMVLQDIPKDVAAFATLVIRAVTLWLAVGLGIIWTSFTINRFMGKEKSLGETSV